MYGDTTIMRKHVLALREQAGDIRATADQLVARADGVDWTGRAATAMRDRIRERASRLRDCAADHETAADLLERHHGEVDRLQDEISDTARRAGALVAAAQSRIVEIESHDDPAEVRREPTDLDRRLADFTPPPQGHKDWLTIDLPGLR